MTLITSRASCDAKKGNRVKDNNNNPRDATAYLKQRQKLKPNQNRDADCHWHFFWSSCRDKNQITKSDTKSQYKYNYENNRITETKKQQKNQTWDCLWHFSWSSCRYKNSKIKLQIKIPNSNTNTNTKRKEKLQRRKIQKIHPEMRRGLSLAFFLIEVQIQKFKN